MGRSPKERALRRAGSDLLSKLRGKEGHIRLSRERREALLEDLGTTPENVEMLLSVEEPDIVDELFPFGAPKPASPATEKHWHMWAHSHSRPEGRY